MPADAHLHASRPRWRWAMLGLAAIALGAPACDEGRAVLPIDSVVELRLAEDAEGVSVQARTQRIYSCVNFTILRRSSVRYGVFGPIFRVDLLGVLPPGGVCLTALSPATATVGLGRLEPGAVLIGVTANGVNATAHLEVTADSLIVTGGNGPWTLWPEPRIARP